VEPRRASRLMASVVLSAVLPVFLAVLAALLPVVVRPAYADTEDDSLLVYCLAPAQHNGLLDAAVALGYAKRDSVGGYVLTSGPPLDPASWYRDHRDDFTRTCKALFAAQRVPDPGISATLLPFLTGLLGAVLAFLATAWRDWVVRGRALADDLRSACNEFHQAVSAYLDNFSSSQLELQVAHRRSALLTQLARARGAHQGWLVVRGVKNDVSSRKIEQTGSRNGSKQETLNWLNQVQDDVYQIANALERPMRPHLAMRGKPDGGGSPGAQA
jgi:hypothetical protein